MKQTLFVIVAMLYFTARSFVDPFWGVLMYYGLGVLRPQFLWKWALPEGVRWSLYAAIIAIVTALIHLKELKKQKIVHPLFIPLILAFAICLVGSYIGAMNKDIAAHAGWEYCKILIMVLVSCFVLKKLWHIRYLVWMIFICLGYIAIDQNLIYIKYGYVSMYHQGFGGLDNNGAGLLLAMFVPFGYFFFFAETRLRRWAYLAVTLPTIHAIMFTYSRGAMLSAVVIGIGMILSSIRRHTLTTILISIFLVCVVSALAGNAVRTRFMTISEKFRDASAHSRYESWKAGYRIARAYPVFGVGLRNSNLLSQDYGADQKGRTIHNVYLQIAADAGIPAALIFILLIGSSFFWLAQGVWRTRSQMDDDEKRWHHYICLACFWSLAGFAFGSIFLSTEVFELCYLLMVIAAFAPALAMVSVKDEASTPIAQDSVKKVPSIAILSGGDLSL